MVTRVLVLEEALLVVEWVGLVVLLLLEMLCHHDQVGVVAEMGGIPVMVVVVVVVVFLQG
jgi:hypothetical protein